ncbi:MAG: hypothetical protein DRH12_19015 [Deltaproteobacteria bacterium]|nr:MAG: hypothetical protein DRH12_19015 [Deltaproteobacteria bacterium]
MLSVLFSSLRGRLTRISLLLLGVLVVSVAFGLFLSASETTVVSVDQDLTQYWRTTYDILVRPPGTRSAIEEKYGLVEANHLSGIPGGITIEQYEAIQRIPGVEVAAPIAMLGYSSQMLRLPAGTYPTPGVYALSCSREEDDGARTYRTNYETFVYLGKDAKELPQSEINNHNIVLGIHPPECVYDLPLLLAAIDPVQEAALIGLDKTVNGAYLDGNTLIQGKSYDTPGGGTEIVYPIPALINATCYVSVSLRSELTQLTLPSDVQDLKTILDRGGNDYLRTLPRHTVVERSASGDTVYEQMLQDLLSGYIRVYQSAPWNRPSPVHYREIISSPVKVQSILLEVIPTGTYIKGWTHGSGDAQLAFRETRRYPVDKTFICSFQGTFDTEKLIKPSKLSAVPLETYYPPLATWRYDESGSPVDALALRPTLNPIGYIQSPPLVLTTLEAARALHGEACISAVRVRVGVIDRFSPQAQSKIEAVASEIVRRTRLDVDVVVGSSPRLLLVHIPGCEDIPPLGYVEEGWIQKGVALTTYRIVQRANVLLFYAMLLICALFILNTAFTSVIGRVREFGLLKAIGWRTTSLLRLVLGEAALIGLLAGAAGVLLSLGLAYALHLSLPWTRAAIILPLGMVLCLAGYACPTLWAVRVASAVATRQGEMEARSGGMLSRWLGYAGRNLWRRRARAALSVVVAGLGAGMLVFFLCLVKGMHGYLALTLLGRYILVHVSGYHWAMLGVVIGVGTISVADTLLAGVMERRREIGVLKAVGWRTGAVAGLFLREGVLLGLAGGVMGSLLGLGAFLALYHVLSWALLWIVVLGVTLPGVAGVLAALYPARVAAKVPPAEAVQYE